MKKHRTPLRFRTTTTTFAGLILIFCAMSFASRGQSVVSYYDYNWKPSSQEAARFIAEVLPTDSGFLRRDYYVQERSMQMAGLYQDADCKKPHGQFYYYHANRKLESLGKYKNGKKDGLWLSFHSNGMMEDSTHYDNGDPVGTSKSWWPNGMPHDSIVYNPDGTAVHVSWFENGTPSAAGRYVMKNVPVGKWKYFHSNGQTSAVEIYLNGMTTERTLYDENGQQMPEGSDQDREASFPGGTKAWDKYLHKKVFFPDRYKLANADQAVVVVTFSVDEDGKVGDAFVSTPLFRQFDDIALKAVQGSPNWLPAIAHNRRIKTWMRQAIVFQQGQ